MQLKEESAESELLLAYDVSDTSKSVQQAMDDAFDNGYGLIAYPLIDPKLDSSELVSPNNDISNIPFSYHSDSTSIIFQSVYGKCSPWITFDPHNNYKTRRCIKLLQQQLDWSLHLGIYSVILPNPLQNDKSTNSSSTMGVISGIHHNDYHENHSIKNLKEEKKENLNSKIIDNFDDDTYFEIAINYASALIQCFKSRVHIVGIVPIVFNAHGFRLWQILSLLLRDLKNIRPALIIEADVASKELMQQWFAQGVQIFILSQDLFLTNKKGFPVLSRAHQKVLLRFLRWTDSTIIISGDTHEIDTKNNKNAARYCQYMRHLRSTSLELSVSEYEEKPFWDILQTPLQPLSNNLEYSTYETFESDPVKYNQYEEAIRECLTDIHKRDMKSRDEPYIVMVLGAGRGPLVTAALSASFSTGISIKLYAIEKNPHAIIILKNKNLCEWNNCVEIIKQDMRSWAYGEKKAHIIISELLGSFGDNELSPECLDGAERLLRDDGISIPCKYTSYLCPVTNNYVYSKLSVKPRDFETPYVIHLMRHSLLSKNIEKVWSFEHPKSLYKHPHGDGHTNERYSKLSFKINKNTSLKCGAIIHGFAGYFDTKLYKNISLSIHPKRASKGMFSWFPMYFPLINPIQCKFNDVIDVHFWRKINDKCVWYEWCVTKPILTQIHNANHRAYRVNLQ